MELEEFFYKIENCFSEIKTHLNDLETKVASLETNSELPTLKYLIESNMFEHKNFDYRITELENKNK